MNDLPKSGEAAAIQVSTIDNLIIQLINRAIKLTYSDIEKLIVSISIDDLLEFMNDLYQLDAISNERKAITFQALYYSSASR
jgi:hypothetical protein